MSGMIRENETYVPMTQTAFDTPTHGPIVPMYHGQAPMAFCPVPRMSIPFGDDMRSPSFQFTNFVPRPYSDIVFDNFVEKDYMKSPSFHVHSW